MIQKQYSGKLEVEYIYPMASASIFIPSYIFDNEKKEWVPKFEKSTDGGLKFHEVTGEPIPIRDRIPFVTVEKAHYLIPESHNAISYKVFTDTPDWIKTGIENLYKNKKNELMTRDEYEKKYHSNSYKLRAGDIKLKAKDEELRIAKEALQVAQKKASKVDELEKRLEQASKPKIKPMK